MVATAAWYRRLRRSLDRRGYYWRRGFRRWRGFSARTPRDRRGGCGGRFCRQGRNFRYWCGLWLGSWLDFGLRLSNGGLRRLLCGFGRRGWLRFCFGFWGGSFRAWGLRRFGASFGGIYLFGNLAAV